LQRYKGRRTSTKIMSSATLIMAKTEREKAKPPSKTALLDAVRRWDADGVKAMLKAAPALVAATDPKGRMALHLACAVTPGAKGLGEPDGIKTVTALLAAGADLEAAVPMDADEGDFRATPLWYALSRGRNLALARFLLKRGADASSSLWTVVFQDDAPACRELLKAKPRLNLRAHGETPIFYAARLQRLKTLALLIVAGADPAIPDPRGRDAVDIARARRLPKDVIGRLEELRRSRKAVAG
jgi:ankyrin repeat protein